MIDLYDSAPNAWLVDAGVIEAREVTVDRSQPKSHQPISGRSRCASSIVSGSRPMPCPRCNRSRRRRHHPHVPPPPRGDRIEQNRSPRRPARHRPTLPAISTSRPPPMTTTSSASITFHGRSTAASTTNVSGNPSTVSQREVSSSRAMSGCHEPNSYSNNPSRETTWATCRRPGRAQEAHPTHPPPSSRRRHPRTRSTCRPVVRPGPRSPGQMMHPGGGDPRSDQPTRRPEHGRAQHHVGYRAQLPNVEGVEENASSIATTM